MTPSIAGPRMGMRMAVSAPPPMAIDTAGSGGQNKKHTGNRKICQIDEGARKGHALSPTHSAALSAAAIAWSRTGTSAFAMCWLKSLAAWMVSWALSMAMRASVVALGSVITTSGESKEDGVVSQFME